MTMMMMMMANSRRGLLRSVISTPRTKGNNHHRRWNHRTVSLFVIFIVIVIYELTTLLVVERHFTTTTTTTDASGDETTNQRSITRRRIHNATTFHHHRRHHHNSSSIVTQHALNSTLRRNRGTDDVAKTTTTRRIHHRPRMWDVLEDLDHDAPTAGQFLLDFAIIGNGKCGTTSLQQWLGHHPEVYCPEKEILQLSLKTVQVFIKKLYMEIPDDGIWLSSSPSSSFVPQDNTKNSSPLNVSTTGPVIHRRGYKNPVEIRFPKSIRALATHFPQTILFVGIRHPVLWFQSLYNFKVQNLPANKPVTYWGHPNDLMKKCSRPDVDLNCVGTYKGLFHLYLAYLGKTNQTKEIQDQYPNLWNEDNMTVTPNPVFLFDVQQLDDAMTTTKRLSNRTTTTTFRAKVDHTNIYNDVNDDSSTREQRGRQFRQNVQTILRLEYPLGPPPHMKPGMKWDDVNLQKKRDEQKMDICTDEFIPLRTHLMEISQQASLWIRSSGFLDAPTVHVSSREYFVKEILGRQWMIDPCTTTSSGVPNVG